MANPERRCERHQRFSRQLIAIALAHFLTACTTQPLAPEAGSAKDLERWQIRGKIGVRSPLENTSAYLNWQQLNDAYTIRLSGPLGSGSLQIVGDTSGVTVRQAGQPDLHAINAEQLLQQRLGWSVPIEYFHSWIRGVPAAAPIDQQTSSDGQLSHLEQAGWRIEYLRYQQFGRITLPTKLRLRHNELNVTVIIKEWQLQVASSRT